MKFSDLQLNDFGHKIMAAGLIYTDGQEDFCLYFPNETPYLQPIPEQAGLVISPTIQEWEALLKQTDDVMIASNRKDPLVHAYVKKSQRNIDQSICWLVYSRDNYTCRYCGRSGIPLTVDHIDLWEDGGITTELNLNTACKPCNRDRGNMSYQDWLGSEKYARRSASLPLPVLEANREQIKTLPELEKRRVNYQRAPR